MPASQLKEASFALPLGFRWGRAREARELSIWLPLGFPVASSWLARGFLLPSYGFLFGADAGEI